MAGSWTERGHFNPLAFLLGTMVLAIDALKGFVACRFVPMLVEAAPSERVRIVAGIAAILGHNYTCWLRFKGGSWMPWALAMVLGVWLIVVLISRYVSLASIAAALSLPLAAWLSAGSYRMVAVAAVVGGLAVYTHRGNIRRLLNGTEHRFGARKRDASTQPTA
jgi:glycerol-3-phosphate acyltransferase PlsY